MLKDYPKVTSTRFHTHSNINTTSRLRGVLEKSHCTVIVHGEVIRVSGQRQIHIEVGGRDLHANFTETRLILNFKILINLL